MVVYIIKKSMQVEGNGVYVSYKDNNVGDQYTDYSTQAKHYISESEAKTYVDSVLANHLNTFFEVNEIIIPA